MMLNNMVLFSGNLNSNLCLFHPGFGHFGCLASPWGAYTVVPGTPNAPNYHNKGDFDIICASFHITKCLVKIRPYIP